MRNNASLLYSFFLVIGDLVAILIAFALAYVLRFHVFQTANLASVPGRSFIQALYTTLPFWLIIHFLLGLYRQDVFEKRFTEIGRLFSGAALGTLTIIGYNFFVTTPFIPGRLVPVYGFVLSFLFLLFFRQVARIVRKLFFTVNRGINNLLIVGDTPVSLELVDLLINTQDTGYKILGVVSKKSSAHDAYPHLVVFETFEEAVENIGLEDIQSIIQTELYSTPGRNNEILTTAQENHIAYRFVPGNSELFIGNIQVDLFRNIPVIAVHQTALLGWGRITKRIFDVLASLAAIIVLSPVMLVIYLSLVLSGGTPIYSRKRLTRFHTYFTIYKFRSLKIAYNGMDPEQGFAKMGKPELAKQFRENGDFLENDPRISRFGHFIRATSLDELPQLFNVLKGDLSLVGPRALIEEELSQSKHKNTILSVKPGLTGLAVVSGRKDIPFEERRKLDLYYVQNWSFWLDITIILKTIRVVLTGRGAR